MSNSLSHDDAVSVERAEPDAWRDMCLAMPREFSETFGADLVDVDPASSTRAEAWRSGG